MEQTSFNRQSSEESIPSRVRSLGPFVSSHLEFFISTWFANLWEIIIGLTIAVIVVTVGEEGVTGIARTLFRKLGRNMRNRRKALTIMVNNEQQPLLITVDKLRKYYGEVKSVNDISLEIAQGQVLTLVGANGAGKTTFLNLLTGLVRPDRGEISLLGEKITGVSPDRRAKMGIVKTFQLEHLFEDMTVFDNVRTAWLSAAGKHYSLFKDIGDEKEINEKTDHLLDLFDLAERKIYPGQELGARIQESN